MYTKILGIFSSKVYSSAIGFIVIILTSRYLGATGRGEISLFIANLALVQLFNEIIIGPAMVFFVPRHKTIHLLFISIFWSLFMSLLVVVVLFFLNLSQDHLTLDLFFMSCIYAVLSSSMKIIQGKLQLKNYNIINILQSSILLISLCTFLFIFKIHSVTAFIYTLYFTYSIPMLLSLFNVLIFCEDFELKGIRKEFTTILKTGFNAQISNFLNFLNTRISYYIIALLYVDKSSLGIFGLATSLVESVWLVSYSIATIQYPLISASDNLSFGAEISMNFSKITFWTSSFLILILILLPESVYIYIFGGEFLGVKKIIILLSPGIIVLSMYKIYWNYFSGVGKFSVNNTAGLTGLLGSVLSSYFFIKYYGITGAAYSTVLSYFLASLYILFVFKKSSGFRFKQLLPAFTDYKLLKQLYSHGNHK